MSPQDQIQAKAHALVMIAVLVGGMVLGGLLSGCGNAANPFKQKDFDNIPSQIVQEKARLELTLLAKLQRLDPFEDLLAPKPEPEPEPSKDGDGEKAPKEEEPKVDPYSKLVLGGVLYYANTPRAIIRNGDGKEGSRIVSAGEVFTNPDGENASIKVAEIGKRSVKLVTLENIPGFEERTLEVVSLVGYKAKAEKKTAAPASDKAAGDDFLGKKRLIEEPDTLDVPNAILDLVKGDSRKNSPEKLKQAHEANSKAR
ncbi:MAG: hypothetical protein KC462_02075 [Cyanobacteria bacterium HKST-UBA05]|nr:hypothetical protein [Cyanobacteria bacterium HKST-UBA05]